MLCFINTTSDNQLYSQWERGDRHTDTHTHTPWVPSSPTRVLHIYCSERTFLSGKEELIKEKRCLKEWRNIKRAILPNSSVCSTQYDIFSIFYSLLMLWLSRQEIEEAEVLKTVVLWQTTPLLAAQKHPDVAMFCTFLHTIPRCTPFIQCLELYALLRTI